MRPSKRWYVLTAITFVELDSSLFPFFVYLFCDLDLPGGHTEYVAISVTTINNFKLNAIIRGLKGVLLCYLLCTAVFRCGDIRFQLQDGGCRGRVDVLGCLADGTLRAE